MASKYFRAMRGGLSLAQGLKSFDAVKPALAFGTAQVPQPRQRAR